MADDGKGELETRWMEDLERLMPALARSTWLAYVGDAEGLVAPIPPLQPEPLEKRISRPLNLSINLLPGRRRAAPKQELEAAAKADEAEAALRKTLGVHVDEFDRMQNEVRRHLELLDAYLMYPSDSDDVQPRLTAVSGLLAALDPYVATVARAGMKAEGVVRTLMLRVCARYRLQRQLLESYTQRASEIPRAFDPRFVTGEYER